MPDGLAARGSGRRAGGRRRDDGRRDDRAEITLEDRHGRDFLEGLIEISRAQAAQRGVVQLYTILSAEATDPEHPVRPYFQQRFHRIADAVTRAFEEVRADGGLLDDVDPRRAALSTLAATEGLELIWLNDLDVDMAEDIRRHVSAFLTTPL